MSPKAHLASALAIAMVSWPGAGEAQVSYFRVPTSPSSSASPGGAGTGGGKVAATPAPTPATSLSYSGFKAVARFRTTAAAPVFKSATLSPLSYFVSGGLPAGLSVDNATGVISGTPIQEETTQAIMFAIASDGNAYSSAPFAIQVTASNLTVDNVPDTTFVVGQPLASPAPSAHDALPVTWTLGSGVVLPLGLSLRSDGAITGTPTVANQSVTATLVASDPSGSLVATNPFVLSTLGALSVSNVEDVAVQAGQVVGAPSPVARGASGAVAWTLAPNSTPLPKGFQGIDPTTGDLKGTGSVPASVTGVVLRATDANGRVADSNPFAVTVRTSDPTVALDMTYRVGSPYDVPPQGSASGVSYAAYLAGTRTPWTPPAGLSLVAATGHIQGSPVAVSDPQSIFVEATSASGAVVPTNAFAVSVLPPLSLASTPLSGVLGQAFNGTAPQPTGTPNASSALTYSLASGSLPAGLSLTPAGTFAGTVSPNANSSTFGLSVVDSEYPPATVTASNVPFNVAPSASSVYPAYVYTDDYPDNYHNNDADETYVPVWYVYDSTPVSTLQQKRCAQYGNGGTTGWYCGIVLNFGQDVVADTFGVDADGWSGTVQFYSRQDGNWHDYPGVPTTAQYWRIIGQAPSQRVMARTFMVGLGGLPAYLPTQLVSASSVIPYQALGLSFYDKVGNNAADGRNFLVSNAYDTSAATSVQALNCGHDGPGGTGLYCGVQLDFGQAVGANTFLVDANDVGNVQFYDTDGNWYDVPATGITSQHFRVLDNKPGETLDVRTFLVGLDGLPPRVAIGVPSATDVLPQVVESYTFSDAFTNNNNWGRFLDVSYVYDALPATVVDAFDCVANGGFCSVQVNFPNQVAADTATLDATGGSEIDYYGNDGNWRPMPPTGAVSQYFRVLASAPTQPLSVRSFRLGLGGVHAAVPSAVPSALKNYPSSVSPEVFTDAVGNNYPDQGYSDLASVYDALPYTEDDSNRCTVEYGGQYYCGFVVDFGTPTAADVFRVDADDVGQVQYLASDGVWTDVSKTGDTARFWRVLSKDPGVTLPVRTFMLGLGGFPAYLTSDVPRAQDVTPSSLVAGSYGPGASSNNQEDYRSANVQVVMDDSSDTSISASYCGSHGPTWYCAVVLDYGTTVAADSAKVDTNPDAVYQYLGTDGTWHDVTGQVTARYWRLIGAQDEALTVRTFEPALDGAGLTFVGLEAASAPPQPPSTTAAANTPATTPPATPTVPAPTLAVSLPSVLKATPDVAFVTSASVVGGKAPYVMSVTSGLLPPGLSVFETTVAGSPSVVDGATGPVAYTGLVVTVVDASGASTSSAPFEIDVDTPSPPLRVTIPQDGSGVVYVRDDVPAGYFHDFTAMTYTKAALGVSGGQGPYQVAVTRGFLPGGLSIIGDTASGFFVAGYAQGLSPRDFAPFSRVNEIYATITVTDANGNSISNFVTFKLDNGPFGVLSSTGPYYVNDDYKFALQ